MRRSAVIFWGVVFGSSHGRSKSMMRRSAVIFRGIVLHTRLDIRFTCRFHIRGHQHCTRDLIERKRHRSQSRSRIERRTSIIPSEGRRPSTTALLTAFQLRSHVRKKGDTWGAGRHIGRYHAYYTNLFALGLPWISRGRYSCNSGQGFTGFHGISEFFTCPEQRVEDVPA